jgi:hypothetical protein
MALFHVVIPHSPFVRFVSNIKRAQKHGVVNGMAKIGKNGLVDCVIICIWIYSIFVPVTGNKTY